MTSGPRPRASVTGCGRPGPELHPARSSACLRGLQSVRAELQCPDYCGRLSAGEAARLGLKAFPYPFTGSVPQRRRVPETAGRRAPRSPPGQWTATLRSSYRLNSSKHQYICHRLCRSPGKKVPTEERSSASWPVSFVRCCFVCFVLFYITVREK